MLGRVAWLSRAVHDLHVCHGIAPHIHQFSAASLLSCPPTAFPSQPCMELTGPMHLQIPIYAHLKEVVGPKGSREAVEINYMKFLAYNGSYKPFGWIPAGDLGAHDADWEHVTVRLSADAQQLLGAYFSAHRWAAPVERC